MRELFSGRRGRVAAGLLVAEVSSATQALVIAAIMPQIVKDLHALGEYPLGFASFIASVLIFMPFAGPWADRYGSRRVLAIALALLAAGLAAAALAPNIGVFVAARFIEGAGGGLDYALTFAVIAKTFDETLRPRMFAVMAGAWVLPAIIGPGLGAFVATAFGWRWAFAGFLPLIAIAALLILPVVDNKPSTRQRGCVRFFAIAILSRDAAGGARVARVVLGIRCVACGISRSGCVCGAAVDRRSRVVA